MSTMSFSEHLGFSNLHCLDLIAATEIKKFNFKPSFNFPQIVVIINILKKA